MRKVYMEKVNNNEQKTQQRKFITSLRNLLDFMNSLPSLYRLTLSTLAFKRSFTVLFPLVIEHHNSSAPLQPTFWRLTETSKVVWTTPSFRPLHLLFIQQIAI